MKSSGRQAQGPRELCHLTAPVAGVQTIIPCAGDDEGTMVDRGEVIGILTLMYIAIESRGKNRDDDGRKSSSGVKITTYSIANLDSMAVRKKTSTTRLPQNLQQQIEDSTTTNDHPQRSQHQRPGSRKEARKQSRTAQKLKKAEHFSQNPRKRAAETEHTESPQRKKIRQNDAAQDQGLHQSTTPIPPLQTSSKVSTLAPLPKKSALHTASKKPAKTAVPEKRVKEASAPLLKDVQEEKEDSYIAYLEAQLGMGKSGKRKSQKKEEDDGLDDLMDWADSFVAPTRVPKVDSASSVSDADSQQDSEEEYNSEEEWQGITQAESGYDDAPTSQRDDEEKAEPAQPAQPAPTGAYIPPHLRKLQDSNSESLQKLTRQLKGLLNRMSEQNIGSIIDSCEEIYREYRRNDVTSTLTTLIIDGISAHSSLLDSYVVLYAAFVSSLHKVIGIEFAAHFVQTTVATYEQYYGNISSTSDVTEQEGKECSNMLVLISELYNFQVISSVLVFDIIRNLLDGNLTEFKVELLLKIVRNSGQQLRQDDPSALKDIIEIVQGRVSTGEDAMSSRTRFMIETLTNLKNNKLKRNVTQNQGGAAVERMKKFLSGLTKSRHVLAHDPLRVSLQDLHSAETKGKWWLVGAAWGGDPLVDKQAEFVKPVAKESEQVDTSNESADLLKLARAQGMNTDIRRGIFVVLMSSDDYIDACERLSQLNLTEVQQREIIRVLLHCCGNERTYNPYYTLVCQQLCRTSHAYKITLQFSLWDFLRDLGEKSVGGAAVVKNIDEHDDFELKSISESRMHNVAKAYGWWIAKDSVTLLILKPVDFTMLKPRTQEFLKVLFVQIFVNSQRTTPMVQTDLSGMTFSRNQSPIEEIFMKATRVQALAMGLVYFLSTMSKGISSADDALSKFVRWAAGVAQETLRTSVDLVSLS